MCHVRELRKATWEWQEGMLNSLKFWWGTVTHMLSRWMALFIEECDVSDVSFVWLKHDFEKEIDWRELVTCSSYDKPDKIGSILALIRPNLIYLLFLHGSHVGTHYKQVLTLYCWSSELISYGFEICQVNHHDWGGPHTVWMFLRRKWSKLNECFAHGKIR